jgi:hypothetical protein
MINRAGIKSAPKPQGGLSPTGKVTHIVFFRDSRSVVDGTGLVRGCEYYAHPPWLSLLASCRKYLSIPAIIE